MNATEFARALGPVARDLLGEPTDRNIAKHELSVGTRGSLYINVDKGTWHDHEAGEGGRLIALVQDRKRLGKSDAVAFAKIGGP